MRLRPLPPTLMLCWPRSILQVQHDKTIGKVQCSVYDHLAGAGGGVAVPDCRCLRVDLANACGRAASIGSTPDRAKPGGAAGPESSVPADPGQFWLLTLPDQWD